MSGNIETPWGQAHVQRQLDDGVFWIETLEHGGLLIDYTQAQETLSEKARAIGKHWHDFLAFERDKEMLVVFYEHPEWYPWMEEELTAQFAEEGLRRDYPDYFDV